MAGLWGGWGGWIKGSNKPKKRLPRETMGKDPSGGRGMSERGESRRGIKPKGNYSGNHRQPAVSSLSPHEVLCFLFVWVFFFCRFRNTREQGSQNSQHSVAFYVLGEPSAKAVSGLNQRGKFSLQAPFSLELPRNNGRTLYANSQVCFTSRRSAVWTRRFNSIFGSLGQNGVRR